MLKTKNKKEIKNFQDLPPEILEKIPSINNDPVLLSIGKKINELEETLHQKRKERDNFGFDYSAPLRPAQSDIAGDAKQLIAGTNIEQLSGQRSDDRERDFIRQIAACQQALELLKEERSIEYCAAIKRACAALPEEVIGIFSAIVPAAEQLEKAIKFALAIDAHLSSKGIEEVRRDPRYRVIDYWRNLLFSRVGWPCLSWVIEKQKILYFGKEGSK